MDEVKCLGEPAVVGGAFIVPSTSSPVKHSYRGEKQPFHDVEVLELGKVTNVVIERKEWGGRRVGNTYKRIGGKRKNSFGAVANSPLSDPLIEKEAQIAFQWRSGSF